MGYYTKHPSCHRRAVHAFGNLTTKKYDEARKTVKKHINAHDDAEVIFTRNTTESINIVARSLSFSEGDIVLTSDAEHNSNLLPWQFLSQREGTLLRTFAIQPHDAFGNLDQFKEWLKGGKVKLVSTFHTSHVTGISQPIKEMAALAHEYGAKVLLDAAQGLPHHEIDVQDLGVDLLAFSFHKVFGPTGMGALYGKRECLESWEPLIVGGNAVEEADYGSCTFCAMPEKFEGGLQDYAGVIGSAAALKYLNQVGVKEVGRHERELNAFITEELSRFPRVKILGPANASLRGSIINFLAEEMDAGEISILLDKAKNIMTRSGVHCCHAWYHKYDLTPSLRVSLSAYNTLEEAQLFLKTLHGMLKYF